MKEFAKRKSKVKIPQVYEQFTSRRVIVTEVGVFCFFSSSSFHFLTLFFLFVLVDTWWQTR